MYRVGEKDHELYEEVLRRLRELLKDIEEGLEPKLVILYGSFARGDWHEGSDIDLLVVSDKVPPSPKDRWYLYRVIVGFPLEPHIYTTREFEELLIHGRMTALDALTEGVILRADEEYKEKIDEMLQETMRRLKPRRIELGWQLNPEAEP
jgi:predicted nucleotidyltransferase